MMTIQQVVSRETQKYIDRISRSTTIGELLANNSYIAGYLNAISDIRIYDFDNAPLTSAEITPLKLSVQIAYNKRLKELI